MEGGSPPATRGYGAMKCPLCGSEFSREEAGEACQHCPLKSCNLVCCPQCGYQFVDEKQARERLKRLLGKKRKGTKE